MSKNNIFKFFVWMRNGFSFCTAWFLMLLVIVCSALKIESIPAETLAKMMLLSAGGVLLFCVFFTELIIRRAPFAARLTLFIVSIGIYECFGFYWLGFFSGSGSVLQWMTFTGIILALYFICLGIYQIYSKKKGELYTSALKKYQSRPDEENEKA